MQVGRAPVAPLSGALTSGVAPLALSALSALTGCAMTDVSTRTVEAPRVERRVRRDPDAPIVTGTWQRDVHGYAGALTWQRCDIESLSSTTSVRVTRTTPRTDVGLPLIAAGAALALLGGSQAVEFEDKDCTPPPEQLCRQETDYHASAIGAFVVGLGAFTVGTVMVTQKPTLRAERLSTEREVTRTTEACVPARDLPELRLAVRITPGHLVPVDLDHDATTARIDLPHGILLPAGVELPIIVSRVPRGATGFMHQNQPIGHIRFESE